MDDHSLQGEGVFEITDYTTASDWERFIANLEETLSEWHLCKQTSAIDETHKELTKGAISSGYWKEKREVVSFGNVSFDLRYQYLDTAFLQKDEESKRVDSPRMGSEEYLDADNEYQTDAIPVEDEKEDDEYDLPDILPECLKDLNATTSDFASKAHCLVRWYNIRRFIILSPRGDTIVSRDRIQLLLSSASIALSNIECHVPIFVQTHNPKNNFYQGISEHSNIRTMYEMVFFRRRLKQFSYLSDLISLFREKSGSTLGDPISVTVRLNYCLDYFDLFVNPTDQFAGNEYTDDELVKMTSSKQKTNHKMQDLRSGATFEQVTEAMKECLPHPYRILKFLHIAALWPPLSDKVITDTQVHSDLEPSEAPIWTIRCVTSDNCNMKIVHETQTVNELLCASIDYAYDKLDGETTFTDSSREMLKSRCIRLSYDLANQPEVVLSETPSDSMRKVVALLFYRAAELTADDDAFRKKPSLGEIYRTFSKFHKPSVKEFIIRSQIPRPFNSKSSPALPQRMFCTICDEEFRLCGAFSELCN